MKTVLVFKTSVSKKKDIKQLRPVLDNLLPKEDLWNFDLEDCDNILRVETQTPHPTLVLNTLHELGYVCEEL
jgi:hypothetical protein